MMGGVVGQGGRGRLRRGAVALGVLGAGALLCYAWWGGEGAVGDEAATPVFELEDARINEASGIVASRRHAGMVYVHNDSGGKAEVFLLDRAGRVRAVVALRGARNVDWEDIAIAPLPVGADGGTSGLAGGGARARGGEEAERAEGAQAAWSVVVGDIGDNAERRPGITLYRFVEPALPAAVGGRVEVEAESFRCRYGDRAHNAEGLIVHPGTYAAYIFTKRDDGRSVVYKLAWPWKRDEVNTLERVGELNRADGAPPLRTIVTAADVSGDGRTLLTRSYWGAWRWDLPAGVEEFERVFAQEPTPVPVAAERQGEAIAFSPDGGRVVTISEGVPTILYETVLEGDAGAGADSDAAKRGSDGAVGDGAVGAGAVADGE